MRGQQRTRRCSWRCPSDQSLRNSINSHSRCRLHAGVGGRVDADEFRAAQLVDLFVPEVQSPADQGALEAGDPAGACHHVDVGTRALEHRLGVGEGCAPAPPFDHPRIAGIGERVGAEVGADQHGVRIGPADLRLGFRQLEPVVDEFPCRHVEFTHDRGVRAAAGQADQRTGVFGVDDAGAGPHPFLVVGPAQLVDVDQHIPLGRVGAVAVQRGAPPQPAGVGRVAPEVVEVVAAADHVGNAGVGVEHLERLGAHPFEILVAKARQRRLVARPHPIQRLVAGDVLEPQVRIVVVFGGGGQLATSWKPLWPRR